ncbi:Methyl-viologen-reducing hydrogenase subunit D [Thermoplasmatales archaeon SCGC AB-539-N05]|nr:Methyl-viologen-reducing hydrogenase subunit D [Thermoplasmatales archaeon SCGC AB-539-N05]
MNQKTLVKSDTSTKSKDDETKGEFKRLKKWEGELDKCIRCGYCYELCPIFKSFNWESDTPRGKLLLLYGIITGEVKPSNDIAEKIFRCFYCENCTDNCSAGVPITEILTDARKDFVDAGFDADGTTAKIEEDLCSACGMCVAVCKAEAISFVEDEEGNRKIAIDKIKCKGCGLCIATCPSGVISQKQGFGVTPSELEAKITQFLKANDTKIIIFCCNWSIFPGLQLSESPTLIDTPYGVIVTMCAGRVNPELLIHAFKEGAWGVMINGCPPEECEHDGNYKARRRILLLKNLFKQLNIESERIRMGWFSSGESIKLKKAITDFVDDIEKLGPIKEPSMISYW